jgi:hypothetical protein
MTWIHVVLMVMEMEMPFFERESTPFPVRREVVGLNHEKGGE